jgi:subtilase family serine protease
MFRHISVPTGGLSMRRVSITPVAAAFGAAALATAIAAGPAQAASTSGAAPNPHSERTCAAARAGFAACLAEVVVNSHGTPQAKARVAPNATPAGYGPSDIQSAYNLSGASGAGRTVAIVDANDDPTAEQDLATYRSTYGLPACSSSNGCFSKVDEFGGTSYPSVDAGWATEESLDLDMVSAACPSCHILLVEADSASFGDLGQAVDTAADLGAVAISNSYGGGDSGASSDYDHPGIAITASTGDEGYGVESPASFDTVVAVGGTSLTRGGGSRGWTESAWSGAGSGCSTLNAKPSWQSSATQCSGKANADVSAVADPATGVAVYDSTPYEGQSGWQVYGGTSASSPIVASVYAMGGVHTSYAAQYTWQNPGALNDVTSGSNGACSPSVWCHSAAGWDGPTGLGTPNGVGSF